MSGATSSAFLVSSKRNLRGSLGSWASRVGGQDIVGRCSCKFLSLSCNLVIERVESLSFGAFKVEPPVTDEIVLVEDGSIRAEEREGAQGSLVISGADVENLALGLSVSIVS